MNFYSMCLVIGFVLLVGNAIYFGVANKKGVLTILYVAAVWVLAMFTGATAIVFGLVWTVVNYRQFAQSNNTPRLR